MRIYIIELLLKLFKLKKRTYVVLVRIEDGMSIFRRDLVGIPYQTSLEKEKAYEYFKKQITSQFPEVVEYPKNTFSLQDSINTLCVEDRIITISLKENFLTFNDLNTTLIMKNYYIEKIKLYKPS